MVVLSNPMHPGEVLQTEFLDKTDWTAGALARAMDVPRAQSSTTSSRAGRG